MASLVQLMRQRELIHSLTIREVKARYRGSALGFFWSMLNPLLMILVYTLVFSVYLRFPVKNYSAYVFCGLLPWIWFTAAVMEGINSIVYGGSLLTKVKFHAGVLPTVKVFSNMVNYLLSLPLLLLFLYLSGFKLGYTLLYIPLLVVIQFLFTMGLVLLLSALNVFYRDVQHLMGNLITLWFFLCPIIYPSEQIPERFKGLVYLNPMGLLIMGYQDVLYHMRMPNPLQLAVLSATSLAVFIIGFALFDHFKSVFVEEL